MSLLETHDVDVLLEELRVITERLDGSSTLEDAIESFERGRSLCETIKTELSRMERRVVEIIDSSGVVTPFEDQRSRK